MGLYVREFFFQKAPRYTYIYSEYTVHQNHIKIYFEQQEKFYQLPYVAIIEFLNFCNLSFVFV